VAAGYRRRPDRPGRPAGRGVPLIRAEPGAYRLRWAILVSEWQAGGSERTGDRTWFDGLGQQLR